jgi:hypothetical protein
VVVASNGDRAKRAYLVADLPAHAAASGQPEARVVIVDPRRAETLTDAPKSGPRDPTQLVRPEPAPGVQLLDGQSLTRGGRVWIDPDLLEQWEREEAEKRRQGS